MNFTALFTDLRARERDAMVIFDHAEPVGRATDLVLPRRRFLDPFRTNKTSRLTTEVSTPNES